MSSQREHIDHSKPLIYEFHDETTGDVLVFDEHDAAFNQMLRADPKHKCRIEARNARCLISGSQEVI